MSKQKRQDKTGVKTSLKGMHCFARDSYVKKLQEIHNGKVDDPTGDDYIASKGKPSMERRMKQYKRGKSA